MQIPAYDPNDPSSLQFILDLIASKVTDLKGFLYSGAGSPNGVVTASPPALYLNRSGGAGTTLYVKESGTNTNTGWVAK